MKKNKRLKIAIVGCGAIGSSLAKLIVKDFSRCAQLVGLFDIQPNKAIELAKKININNVLCRGIDSLIERADLVIEATHMLSALDIAYKAIRKSKDVMIMSAGGIVGRYERLKELARKYGANIFVPSGAIAGIDAVKASLGGKIKKIRLTTTKPPNSFIGVEYLKKNKINLQKIKSETVLFEGNAIEAIKSFPQNINVAATLSMAGIGPHRTIVRIIVSPKASRNVHEIEIQAESGGILTRTENAVHPENPKTSYLAVLSAVATLKQIFEPLKIGT